MKGTTLSPGDERLIVFIRGKARNEHFAHAKLIVLFMDVSNTTGSQYVPTIYPFSSARNARLSVAATTW